MQKQMNKSLSEQLHQGILQLGLSVNKDTQQKLLAYLALLVKWNKIYNLTAIRDPQQMVSHHLLDSLAVLPHLKTGHWLDVGCGAGLPGLVLAICQPDWEITLIDSNSKKTGFVQQAIIELAISNARVHCIRVENFQPADKFDGIISRAFTELGDFVRMTRHLLATDGRWVAMKGMPEQELANVSADSVVEQVISLVVPGVDAARSLVVVLPGGKYD